MVLLFVVIFILLWLTPLFTVIRHGRGVVMPNFSRVDKILSEKNSFHSIMPQWDSTFGKIIYYFHLTLTALAVLFFITLFFVF